MILSARRFLAVAIVSLASTAASAGLATLDGTGFSVQYDDTTLGALGATAPFISGIDNSLVFTPGGGALTANTTTNLLSALAASLTVKADSGLLVTGFGLTVDGTYLIWGAGNPLSVSGSLTQTSGAAGSVALAVTDPFVANAFGNAALRNWSGQATLDIDPLESVDLRIEIAAQALAAGGPSYGQITPRGVSLEVFTVAAPPASSVPEPSSALLLLGALGLLGVRRKSANKTAKP